jgi:hypothetical protein
MNRGVRRCSRPRNGRADNVIDVANHSGIAEVKWRFQTTMVVLLGCH